VVDGKKRPDTTFTDADPPIGGLRTWSQIKSNKPDKSTQTTKIADIPKEIRKLLKTKPPIPRTSTTTTYNSILQHARDLGADHNIHAHSEAPYRARRDALEVMWGVHAHRCHREFGPSLTCTKCLSSLTNTHILGDANSAPNSGHYDIIAHVDSYISSYTTPTAADGPL
jgi:hypothetical protein